MTSIVRNGITGFFWRETPPEFPFIGFKQIVFGCATRSGFAVANIIERGVTPNFHTAVLDNSRERLLMLGHSTYPIIAFAQPHESDYACSLVFRDAKVIADSIAEMFPDAIVATAAELSKSIATSDLARLNPAEIEQFNYWKPTTVGELAFNWWD
jgi:hypothetical protein